jgi:hypothetical protein
MEHNHNRFAREAASDDDVSPVQPLEDDALYWRGVADGLARAGLPVPADVAARAGAPPPPGDVLAFDPVPLRYRDDGLTPEKQRAYVEALADCGVAREAAARIGISERSINRLRRRTDARSFDRACAAAHRFGARHLRSVAYERAIEGTLKGHYYHGERISEERVYDNRLLIYLLGKTEHLDDSADLESRDVCENWEPCMEALERGLPMPAGLGADDDEFGEPSAGDEQVWLEDETWWTLFPPPEDFDGEEEGELGDDDYQRTLSADEEAALLAMRAAARDRELARCCAMRDRFFGLERRGAPGLSLSREAGLSGPSGPSGPFKAPSGPGGGDRAPADPVEKTSESDHTAPDPSSGGGTGP